MRPCFIEMIKGLIHTWENEIFPFVSESGQGELIRQMKGGSTVLRLLAALYENEGEKLFYGNRALRKAFEESIPALRKAGLQNLADTVTDQIAREYFPRDDYPSQKMLLRESNDLNTVLENVLTEISALRSGDNALDQVHDRLFEIMKQQVEQNMDMEMIIRGDYSRLENKMDEHTRFVYADL